MEDETAAESRNYTGHGDGAVEEAQVGADVAARESIGEDGEGHGEHSGRRSHEGVANERRAYWLWMKYTEMKPTAPMRRLSG